MAMESAMNGESVDIFKQLEEYPWDKDREFQGGLAAILGPNPQPSQVEDLTLRAQCFYLSRKRSVPIDFNSYKSYRLSKTDSQPITENRSQFTTETQSQSSLENQPQPTTQTTSDTTTTPPIDDPSSTIPDWQLAYAGAPPPPPPTYTTPSSHATIENLNPSGAPYPKSFAEIVELITSGKPIPGIKDIPEGVRPEQASIPVLPKRRKPWERDVPEAQIQGEIGGTFGDERDIYIPQELPDA